MEDNLDSFINSALEENYSSLCTECIKEFKRLYQESKAVPVPGDMVKVDFKPQGHEGECIWMDLTRNEESEGPWFGTLANIPEPGTMPGSYTLGTEVSFNPKDIMMHIPAGTEPKEGAKIIYEVTAQVSKRHGEEDHGQTEG